MPSSSRDVEVSLSPTPTPTPTTTVTTSTSTGRQSTGLAPQQHGATPDRSHCTEAMDDAAIFIEDTIDRSTARCLATSPSALAILTPQRMPSGGSHHHVDVTDYDAENIGSASSSLKKKRRSGSGGGGPAAAAAHHTNTSVGSHGTAATTGGVRLSFGRSPTPKAAHRASTGGGSGSHNTSLSRSTPGRDSTYTRRRLCGATPSPSVSRPHSHHHNHSGHSGFDHCYGEDEDERAATPAEPMVPLAELERVERERNRFEKMHEHQRALYENMADKHADTHTALQEKIVEVVALSTRNEESKKFIRQLKREMTESRTRVMDIQNRALEGARADRDAKTRYEALLEDHERKYSHVVERHETRMAAMESLVKDLTCMRGEGERLHVAQLDALLKAAYAKSTALFSDMLRQGRQIDLLYDSRDDVERQVDHLRRDKRNLEGALQDERRRMMEESERFIQQIEEQQRSILDLRQMLIRALDANNDASYDDDEEEEEVERSYDDEDGGYGYGYGQQQRRRHRRARSFDSDEIARRDEEESDERSWGSSAPGSDSGTCAAGSGKEEKEEAAATRASDATALAFIRSRVVSFGGTTAPSATGSSSAARARPVATAKTAAPTGSATLSSNTVITTRGGGSREDKENGGRHGNSIFSPPQRAAAVAVAAAREHNHLRPNGSSGITEGKAEEEGHDYGDDGQEEEEATVSKDAAAPVTLPVSKPPPSLRDRKAHPTLSSGSSSNSSSSKNSRTSSKAAPTAPRTATGAGADTKQPGEAYRIPRHDDEKEHTNSGSNSNSGGESSAATTRKRLDFTTALAAVAAKREQDRKEREKSLGSDKENCQHHQQPTITVTVPTATTIVKPSAASSSVLRQPLRQQSGNSAGRSGAAAASQVDENDENDEDNDDVPRLVPRPQQRTALRQLSQTDK